MPNAMSDIISSSIPYQVLARKWRPKNFAQLVGQEAVSTALMHALAENRLHHAYLFTGTRGVGKTTVARILAKCLSCEQGVGPEPCGVCSICQEIDGGRFPDLIEVDAASRTRVEDTKELLENVVYAPVQGRYKIYLIDEVHMLSGHSFNALLKTLEEPPPHVKFIFATTEPERMPVTVLSRCLHFSLRPITMPVLTQQLEKILTSENIAYESKAIHLLAKAGKGSLRDCLSLLEQAVGLGQGQVQTESVADMLGLQEQALMLPLMQALCANEVTRVFEITSQLAQSGADFERLLELILENLHALSMMQMVPDAKTHVQNLKQVEEDILELHTQLKPEQTQLYYQIALLGKRDLSIMPDAARAFEMVLLRMLCFQLAPEQPVHRPLPVATVAKPMAPLVQAAQPAQPVQSIPERQSFRQREIPDHNQAPNWRELITRLNLTGLLKLIAQHCVIERWAPPVVHLVLEASQQPFLNADREKQLGDILSQHFKQDIKVTIKIGGESHSVTTPAKQIQSENRQKQSQAQAALANDEVVQTLIDVFDAKLTKLTVIDEK